MKKKEIEHEAFKDSATIEREISKRKRNTILVHILGIPYYYGKKVHKITLHLGESSVDLGRKAHKITQKEGYELGDILAKNIKRVEVIVKEK